MSRHCGWSQSEFRFGFCTMKCPLELLFIISLLPAASRALRCARTSLAEDSPQKNQTCVFPFTFGNTTYPECTRNHDEFGQPWCSTKVDSNGKHVSGSEHWGYCDPGKITPIRIGQVSLFSMTKFKTTLLTKDWQWRRRSDKSDGLVM